MDPRLPIAVAAGKAAAAVSRRLGRGGGTALPGLVAERVDPRIAEHLGRQLAGGRLLITGTNGKTTASRMLSSILEAAGIPAVHNREGSNLMRGITSTLLAAAGPSGRIAGANLRVGLFETDEATLPPAARALAPRAIAFTNLFRDQLDRYGEVESVAALWREGLAATPGGATLVLNADDPSVAELATGWSGPIHWFGVDDAAFASDRAGTRDARWCRTCGGDFLYERRYFAHVGWWRCDGCGRERPAPDTAAANVRLGLDGSRFDVEGLGAVEMRLTGLYNVWNALAAIGLARVLGIAESAILDGLRAVEPAFGRQETVVLEGRRLHLLLCKNPAGANEVLRLLASLEGTLAVAVLLNARFADGQDVSWTWDVEYELLAARVGRAWAGGERAEEMALRLRYAEWPQAEVSVSPAGLLDAILRESSPGEDIFVIPTYTAMLDLRAELVRRGAAQPFWEREA